MSQPPDAPDPYLPPPPQGYPQQPYPSQPYPSQPYPSQPYPQQPYPSQQVGASGPYQGGSVDQLRRQRPSSVTRLVQVMFLGALVALVTGVYTLTTIDSVLAEATADVDAAAAESGMDPAQLVDFVTTVGVVAVVGGSLLTIGLWLLFGWLFSQGRARTAGIVLGIVNGAFSLLALLGSLLAIDPVELLLYLANLAAIAGGLVLLWRPATSAWFAAVAAARQRTAWR